MSFAENLRALAGMHGLKYSDVAELTGLSRQTFSNWVAQRSDPSLESAQRVASFFAIPLDALTAATPREAILRALEGWETDPPSPARQAQMRLTATLDAFYEVGLVQRAGEE